jgi:glycosyltransferase involved in cell wall biosynthesis
MNIVMNTLTPRFNYIVTIHNKEDLIEKVLTAILVTAGGNSHIYLVLDGCTDGTEAVVDKMLSDWVGLPATKIYAPDVHEIKSLNIALRFAPQVGEGFNVLIQDDIILRDRNLEKKIISIYRHFNEKIGVLSFRHGANIDVDATNAEIAEADLIESVYGQGIVETPLEPGCAVSRMVCMRSPQCVSFETIRSVGLLDEKYAPYTYDDYDYAIRCIRAGLTNVVYALKISSKVEWGGMRRSPQPGVAAIMSRNRQYIYRDHAEFIMTLKRDSFQQSPIKIVVDEANEDTATAIRAYQENKRHLKSFLQRRRFEFVRRLREKFSI